MFERPKIAGCYFLLGVFSALFLASDSAAQQEQKSPAKAFFYSLLVPGLGQRYVENVGNARYFIAAEVLLFGLAVGHEKYSGWLEEDYRAFAAAHAGINPAGKSKSFFVEISRYNTIYVYNEKMRINRDLDKIIPEIPENIWVWDLEANRFAFHDRRVDADTTQNRTIYFYSAMLLNHVISGIHAVIKAKRHHARNKESRLDLRLVTRPNPANPTQMLLLAFRF